MKVAQVNGVVGWGSLRNQAYPHSHMSLVFFEYWRNQMITIWLWRDNGYWGEYRDKSILCPQLTSAEHICNAVRFDNKAGPIVGSIMETILRMQMVSKTLCRRRWIVTNGLMCGSTVRKIYGIAIWKLSEITELSGSNSVRTIRKN